MVNLTAYNSRSHKCSRKASLHYALLLHFWRMRRPVSVNLLDDVRKIMRAQSQRRPGRKKKWIEPIRFDIYLSVAFHHLYFYSETHRAGENICQFSKGYWSVAFLKL